MIILLSFLILLTSLLFIPIKIFIRLYPFDIQIYYLGILYLHREKSLKVFFFSIHLNKHKKKPPQKSLYRSRTQEKFTDKVSDSQLNPKNLIQYYKNYKQMGFYLKNKMKKRLKNFFIIVWSSVKIERIVCSFGFDNLMLQGIYSGLFIPMSSKRFVFKGNFLQKKSFEVQVKISLYILLYGFFYFIFFFPWLATYKNITQIVKK